MRKIHMTALLALCACLLCACKSGTGIVKSAPLAPAVAPVRSYATETVAPTPVITAEPTPAITFEPMAEITAAPTIEMTAEPTIEMTAEPTAEITAEPTAEITAEPTAEITAEAAREIRLYLNGNRLPLATPCVMKDGVIMAPAAEVLDRFSRDITSVQEGDVLTVSDTGLNHTIVITAGQSAATLDGGSVNMDAAAYMSENQTLMIPLTAFRALFDAENSFVDEFDAAYIVESGLC